MDYTGGHYVGVTLFIEYLKRQLSPAPASAPSAGVAPTNAGKLADNKGLVEYLLDFWCADSTYIRKKAKVDGEALSMAYVKANQHDIETHVKTYQGFRSLPLGALTAGAIEDWKLWAIESHRITPTGYSARELRELPASLIKRR